MYRLFNLIMMYQKVSIFATLMFWAMMVTPSVAWAQYKATGKASFYAEKFHGRLTASGEVFHRDSMTCAHKNLPFNTLLEVTNLRNGEKTVVRVNDRGPFKAGRIIDLAPAAARKLGMEGAGVTEVKVKAIGKWQPGQKKPNASSSGETASKPKPKVDFYRIAVDRQAPIGFGVQVGSFKQLKSLLNTLEDLRNQGYDDIYSQVTLLEEEETFYRVMIGRFEQREQAEKYQKYLENEGLKGFVKAYENL